MERTIRVTGEGKLSVQPDTIQLNIRAEGLFPEYEKAVRHSASDLELLRECVKTAGLDPKALKTTYFGVDTEYERYRDKNGDYRDKFAGYKYHHRMHLRFPKDNSLLGRILHEISGSPVSAEFYIEYTVADPEPSKNELIAAAVVNSKAKAEVLTAAAGVRLGNVITIDYSWGEVYVRSRPFELGECEVVRSYDLDIEPEDVDLKDTVTVVWEILV